MMNREELEELMEEFNVKPMTKGLGFHHSLSDKKEVKSNLEMQKNALLTDIESRSEKLYRNNNPQPRYKKTDQVNMGELSAFYEPQEIKSVRHLPDLIDKNEAIMTYEASLLQRFVAWTIDVTIVLSMLATAIMAIILFSDLELNSLNNVFLAEDLLISFSVMFVLFYLFYFSFFDKSRYSTLGKRLLNLRVDAISSEIDYVASFARASLSVFSVLTLGLFTLLTLHDSFTGTKVIKAHE